MAAEVPRKGEAARGLAAAAIAAHPLNGEKGSAAATARSGELIQGLGAAAVPIAVEQVRVLEVEAGAEAEELSSVPSCMSRTLGSTTEFLSSDNWRESS